MIKKLIRKMQTAAGGPITRYETLPNIEVVGYRPIELKTYKPLHKDYPFTGHSSLDIPIDEDTAYTQGWYSPYGISVDKTANSKDYNLITNNCADATLGALNYIFGTNERPYLFTTPGDVRDYAINKLHGKVTRDKNGIDTILIPRNKSNAKKISKRALEWKKNKDEDTVYEYEFKQQGNKTNPLEFLKKGGQIRKMQTAAGGGLRLKFTPEQISYFESRGLPLGMNNSKNYREEGVLALLHQELEKTRKELEIASRMEMKPVLVKKASKLGEKDLYKLQVNTAAGVVSPVDPVAEFFMYGNPTLKGAEALFKTGLLGAARFAPRTQLGNYGRLYFINNAMKFNNLPYYESIAEVPLQKGYMYHSHSNPSIGFVKNGVHWNNLPKPGALHIKDGKYVSTRYSGNPENDRIWWDLNGHNLALNVYVTRESGYTIDDPQSLAIPGYGSYHSSYRTTPQIDVNSVVKFKYDPMGNTYIPQSPFRSITTNRMSIEELFTPETKKVVEEPLTSLKFFERKPSTIQISPEELYKVFKDQELNGYYFMGHGTGRTNVNPLIIFDNGLRIKNGDIGNTTVPISLSNLSLWPHANSKEVIILPGKAENVKFDAARGRIPSDWYDSKTFQWDDNPGFEGSGLFAALKPNATFVETEINGVPGVYTKPEAILGSYNIDTHTLKLNPRSLYNFFKKQGGKMNILEFLKNGSRIHIKEKNKGKFTSYCGGKVTDECIRKAKASGNPTLVKRATFADNARHFKHKSGGKAFVEGVSVLDSNPNAYKHVKKKVKMRLYGGPLEYLFKEAQYLKWVNDYLNPTVINHNPDIDANRNFKFNNSILQLTDEYNNLKLLEAERINNEAQRYSSFLSKGLELLFGYLNKSNNSTNFSTNSWSKVNKDLAGTSYIKPDTNNKLFTSNVIGSNMNVTYDDMRNLIMQ